ncbi:MAG TPA: hypothetical protein VD998_01975 [Verrucomicrobiae bacterium]|nr:hypothetical protein [Verrucomicrobiae bacterium]
MQTQATKTKLESVIEYASGFEAPLEQYFLSEKQKEKIAFEKRKLDATTQYAQSVLKHPDLGKNLEKDIVSGQIYSNSEAANVRARLLALAGNGVRAELKTSIVNPSGQLVILSENSARELGIMADGFVLEQNLDEFIAALKKEGIDDAALNRIKKAAAEYGAVIYQRGGYAALKPMLEEVVAISNVKSSFEAYKSNLENPKPQQPTPVPHGTSLNALKDRVVTPTVTAPSKPSVPPVSANELKREITAKELPKHQEPIKPSVPASVPPPIAKAEPMRTPNPTPVQMPKLNNKPSSGLPSIKNINVVDDLKKIEAAHLRQGYLPEQVKLLKSKIAYLAGVNKMLPVQVATVFEQSPLFKLYLKMGSSMIAQSTHDEKADFRQVAVNMANSGQEILSLQEFEAIADLRKDLERM